MTFDDILDWIVQYALPLVVGVIVLLALYRILRPLIHRVVSGLFHVQQVALSAEDAGEVEARVDAGSWPWASSSICWWPSSSAFRPVAAPRGLGLLAAALTLAGQDIVLDYLMGILILVEGHYYKGDWIAIGDPLGPVQGEVEDIGLRKTTIRDATGTVHNVSNGLIRLSSNLDARVFGGERRGPGPARRRHRPHDRDRGSRRQRTVDRPRVGRGPVRCADPDRGDRPCRGRRDRAGLAARATDAARTGDGPSCGGCCRRAWRQNRSGWAGGTPRLAAAVPVPHESAAEPGADVEQAPAEEAPGGDAPG